MNFCTKCGSKLESTKFCTTCGSPIDQGVPTNPTPPPRFDVGGAAATTQGKSQAPKAPPRAPTCMECGKPVTSGQFLCSDCAARKAQPKTQPSAAQPVSYLPPVQKPNWFVRLVGGLGVAYLCWLGFSAVLVNKASSPADPLPRLESNTQSSTNTLDSVVRPELNQSDRDIDTLIGAWRHKVLDFESRYGFYDPWNQNAACKLGGSNAQTDLIIDIIPSSARTLKALQELSRSATANGQTSAAMYQQEIRDKFPLFFTESLPQAPNLPNNPNDYLPNNTSDYYNSPR